jgi:hypothetical protein
MSPAKIPTEQTMRLSTLRTALLFGSVFLAGVAVGLASTLIGHFNRDLGVGTAFAQESDRAASYSLLALFGFVFECVRTEVAGRI